MSLEYVGYNLQCKNVNKKDIFVLYSLICATLVDTPFLIGILCRLKFVIIYFILLFFRISASEH